MSPIGELPATPVAPGTLGISPATQQGGLYPQPLEAMSGFDFIQALGDLIVGVSPGQVDNLPIGTDGQMLTVNGGTAVWGPPNSGPAGPQGPQGIQGPPGAANSAYSGTWRWTTAADASVSGR